MEGSQSAAASAAASGTGTQGTAQAAAQSTEGAAQAVEAQTPSGDIMQEEREEQIKRSKRDQFVEKYKAANPDFNDSDDEALFGQIDNDYNEVTQERDRYKKGQEDLAKFLSENPKAAMVFSDMMDGKSFPAAVIANYGRDAFNAGDDAEIISQIEEADKSFKERMQSIEATQSERMQNLQETAQEREAFMQEHKMSEEAFAQFIDETVNPMIEDYFMGRIGRGLLEAAYKAKEFDSAVTEAEAIGKVQGRNEKIVEQKKSFKGDGLPVMETVTAAEAAPKKPKNQSFFAGADI